MSGDRLAIEVASYLNRLGYPSAWPIHLTIDGIKYSAARYTVDGQTRIYVAGKLPRSYIRRKATCYRINSSAIDWFIACYMEEINISQCNFDQQQFHPFGETFLLVEYSGYEPIDKYNYWRGEHKPYTRIAAQLELITE